MLDVDLEAFDGGHDGTVGFDDADDGEIVSGDVGDAAGQGCGGLDIADGDDRCAASVGVEGFTDLDGLGFGVV
ncbi:hypothetical protein MYFR107205_30725 [Mycolicibacterium frederiksbergense]